MPSSANRLKWNRDPSQGPGTSTSPPEEAIPQLSVAHAHQNLSLYHSTTYSVRTRPALVPNARVMGINPRNVPHHESNRLSSQID